MCSKEKITAIGIMSGTSLDALDLCACEFEFKAGKWHYNILQTYSIPYTKKWIERLLKAEDCSSREFWEIHVSFGRFIGEEAAKFIEKFNLKVDLISAHGQTIFHQPNKRFSCQIGDGSAIAASVQLPVVNDFRSLSLAYGGQGAPLVPIGDRLLFADFDYCVNIGGFSNISYKEKDETKAFDICAANFLLNYLSRKINLPYDKDGMIARNTHLNKDLFEQLNKIAYFQHKPPKSIGKEWFSENYKPIINQFDISIEEKISSATEHIAYQIAQVINDRNKKALLSGGGVRNKYLVERIQYYSKAKIIIPSEEIIDFKEALIFAFLGVLRMKNQENVLFSYAGGSKNTCSGAIILG